MTQYCLPALSSFDPMLRQALRILVACDFDGTLCGIANLPSEVEVAPYMLATLRRMAASSRVKLVIISGRKLDDVAQRLPIDAVFAGNHGLEIRGRGLQFEHEVARQLRPELRRGCHELVEVLRPWPEAWIEDKSLSATVHYRLVDVCEHHLVRRAVRRCVVGRYPCTGLRAGRRALELYPKIGWDKGAALNYIKDHSGPFDVCICLGDDQTDETMFHDVPGQINIKVGPCRPTRAKFHLLEPTGVAIFLSHVLDVCEPSTDSKAFWKTEVAKAS